MNKLNLYMLNLEHALKELAQLLHESTDVGSCVFYDVEPVTTALEQTIIDDGYSAINVSTLHGEQAFIRILDAFTDFYVFDDATSRRFVKKFPGYLVINKHFDRVSSAIQTVNECKTLFKEEVLNIGDDALAKWQQVHDRFNYLVTIAVYRKIYLFTSPIHAVYFNWVTRPRVVNLTFAQAMEKCERAKFTLPIGYTYQSWCSLLDAEKSIIEQHAQSQFSQRRQIKLRPEAKIRFVDDKNGLGYSAGLPFVFFNRPKRSTHLGSFSIENKRKNSRSTDWRILIERMNLYIK